MKIRENINKILHSEHHIGLFSYILIKERKQVRFLMISGIILGLIVGVIGCAFRLTIGLLSDLRTDLITIYGTSTIWKYSMSILFTTSMLLLAIFLVKKFAPEAGGSGIHEIEGVLSNKRYLRWQRVLPVKFISGALSLSSGLVLGREGPTIHIGGTVGKMIGKRFRLNLEHTHIVIAAGAAAGLATAFNAPMSGILFVIEEMHSHFRYSFKSLQCVIVASISSVIVLRTFLGQTPDLLMTHIPAPPIASLYIFIIFGIIFGFMGVLFNKYLVVFLDLYSRLKGYKYWLGVTCFAVLIGILNQAFPYVTTGGTNVIEAALGYKISIMMLLLIFVARLFTTWGSYGTGTTGGIFAPMLALGSVFGMWFGHFTHVMYPNWITDPSMFAVAGMTALFTATVGAPITAIVLVVEMTTNYSLILPLMVTCFCATMTSYVLGGNPIYETLLERTIRMERKQADEMLKQTQRELKKTFKTAK